MDPTQQLAASAIPSDGAAAPRLRPVGGSLLSRLEPRASLARHKWLALSLFLLISFAGLTIASIQGRPAYRTQAVVSVSPRSNKNLQGDGRFQSQPSSPCREFVQQNARNIRKINVAGETLSRLGGKGRRWWYRPGESDRRAAERLAASLLVTSSLETCQVTVSLDGDRPEGLSEIVNTLLSVYVDAPNSGQLDRAESYLPALLQESGSHAIELVDNQGRKMEPARPSMDFENRVPGAVRMVAAAQPAGLSSWGRWTALPLLFLLAGIAVAFLAPVAIDFTDPRLLIPADAARAVGAELLGWVPDREESGEEFTWELILRIANRIDQERQARGARIWMFTAVNSGGGTTTLVNSLARALTMLGVPALSVEANAYCADGRFARNSTGLGLSALLRGHASLSESIETEDAEMPDHIPVGELDGSGHLPDIHRLMEIFGEALESYALVLVDIPPLLDCVDSEYLARRADCAVLVAEARQVAAPELKRAARLLDRIQPKAVTCILNRVHSADGHGFAQHARREFETGAPKPIPAWQHPSLGR